MNAPLRRLVPALVVALLLASPLLPAGAGAATPRLDPTFGQGGHARPVYGPGFEGASFPFGRLEADGSIVVDRQDGGDGPGYVTEERYLADGRLDPSFKTEAKDLEVEARDARGRTLRTSSPERQQTIERLNPDGSVDTTFGCDQPGPCHSYTEFRIDAILPLPSGKIVVAGAIGGRREGSPVIEELALARFDESGAFDPSFGQGGTVHLKADDGVGGEEVVGLTLGQGEDVLVSLNDEASWEQNLNLTVGGSKVAAVGPSGQLDPGFGVAGVVASEGHIGAVEGLAGGALLIAGERWGATLEPFLDLRDGDVSLNRLTPTGAPDPGFGEGDGTTVVDLGGTDLATALLRRPDGSIVVGAVDTVPHQRCVMPYVWTSCAETPALLGFEPDGALAPGFGKAGVLRLDRLRYEAVIASPVGVLFLHELPGGGVLAGGGTRAAGFLAEVDPAGRLLPGFGDGGIVSVTHPRKSYSRPLQMATDAKGRLVVLGETTAGQNPDPSVPAVFRLHPNGRVDRSFGDGRGFVNVPGHLIAMALDQRGRALVLTGKYSPNSLARLTAGGRLDPRFGVEGIATLPRGVPGLVHGKRRKIVAYPRTVLALPGGGALVTAVSGSGEGSPNARLDLFRLTPSGALDPSFGRDGIRQLTFPAVGVPRVRAAKLMADGRIVLGGSVRARGPGGPKRQTAAVFRLTVDGLPDPTFGDRGLVTFGFRGQGVVTALALGPGGEIVAAGRHGRAHEESRPLLERLSASGRTDRAFSRRVAATSAGAAAETTEPTKVLLWRGRIALVPAYNPDLAIYAGDGSLERVLDFGKERRPRTWIMAATLQRGALVVATKTARRLTYTLTRLLP
jgi:uncharacterized delta-60 repeat protein